LEAGDATSGRKDGAVSRIRVGLVGIGKIAQDQHIPVLRRSDDFALCATVSGHDGIAGTQNFATVEDMLAHADLGAVAICTPPQTHFALARVCLLAGVHVLLEKPPCRTVAELDALHALAGRGNVTLFQSWHSRFAPGVSPAANALANETVREGAIVWREDVRRWHPGQSWITQAGGFGVFDPGINALSILTKILLSPVFVSDATLFVPANWETPIAAELSLRAESGAPITAAFDFRETGPQRWDIKLDTDKGTVVLTDGGATLAIDGKPAEAEHADEDNPEYAPLYRHFADLIHRGVSDADARPFRLVADAFLLARHVTVEPFHE
jgi:D-galactose 1-dehydrogenase